MIDTRAVIDPSAKIASDVTVGPFTVIGQEVEIGSGTWIGPHAFIKGPTKIGCYNKIFQFASVGEDTQDKKYQGEKTYLEIGDYNTIREFCTINRGSTQDQGITRIGNHNLLMAYVHIAHDCQIGNHTIFDNNATLAGHVRVDDYVILSGFAGIYQFCRLGKHSFTSAGAIVIKDVPPFIKVAGVYAKPFGLNTVGLTRYGFDETTKMMLKKGYKIIYREGLTTAQAIEELQTMVPQCPEINLYVEFLQNSVHGIVR
jgi:UDP-N-acetylglucosamine acyltransferase